MKLQQFKFLTDENIHPEVVDFLVNLGHDIVDIKKSNLSGTDDFFIIRKSFPERRVIITHDSDFGTITIANSEPFIGIIYLRPGHINPEFTKTVLLELFSRDIEVNPPFIIVAERTGEQIKIRIRNL
ncbi:MAG: DUF5615 family PIN-like protein [Candidatus Eremiobacterota bacterium]